MNKLTLLPHEEIRTELVRLYMEQEHPAILAQLQEEVREVTNHMVRGRRDVKNAVIAYALRNGLCQKPPTFSPEPQLPKPTTKEEKSEVAEAWKQYYKVNEYEKRVYAQWLSQVFKAVKGIPECEWRNDSYQTLRSIYGKIGDCILYRDTVRRVNGTKRAKAKKPVDWIPLVWGNSPLIQTGEFYGQRRGVPWYNAFVKIPGVKKPFLGRLRRPLPGKPIQGVTLVMKADGLYAAIKCIVPKRQLPEPVMPEVGVDVGQTDLVALSDGHTERNIRDAEFVAIKAAIQSKGDLSKDSNTQARCKSKVARMDQSRKRRITHWINSDLLPRLTQHSIVFVEKLAKNFKSDKGPLSCMHIILNAIKQRLGDLDRKGKMGPKTRVVEVPCAGTSQTCSCCGEQENILRKRKLFTCFAASCNASLDADVNAARNILAKGLELLRAA